MFLVLLAQSGKVVQRAVLFTCVFLNCNETTRTYAVQVCTHLVPNRRQRFSSMPIFLVYIVGFVLSSVIDYFCSDMFVLLYVEDL